MSTKTEATIEDLYRYEGKAELVDGEIVPMAASGDWPNFAAGEIFASLRDYARQTRRGRAYVDNGGFVVNLENRRSFSPDAAFYIGPSNKMKFASGAPIFAVEIRSEGDYGKSAERLLAAK